MEQWSDVPRWARPIVYVLVAFIGVVALLLMGAVVLLLIKLAMWLFVGVFG